MFANNLLRYNIINSTYKHSVMPQEIEMKLSINQQQIESLQSHPLIQQSQQQTDQQTVVSHYYDTPNLDLHSQGLALRIRQQDTQCWLTVKDGGSSQQGLHERQEWEYPLTDTNWSISLLPDELQPRIQPYYEQLQKLFTTEFKRSTWLIDWKNTQIEAALDVGSIYVDQRWQEPISELELEIKQGDKQGLMDFCQTLNRDLALKPFDQSKAYRGYRLAYMAHQNA